MSVQHIWNLFQLLGLFTCRKLANLSWNVQTNYFAKNWALAMMLKALPLVHFWSVLLLKEQMMTSVRKTLKRLVWSAQNRSISSQICLENNHKIGCFFTDCFSVKFAPKNSREISRFFREFVPKNPAKFDFFFRDLSEALLTRQTPLHQQKGVQISVPQNFSQGDKLSPSDRILAQTLYLCIPLKC